VIVALVAVLAATAAAIAAAAARVPVAVPAVVRSGRGARVYRSRWAKHPAPPLPSRLRCP